MEERLLAMEHKMNKEDGAGVNISSIIVFYIIVKFKYNVGIQTA